MGIKSAKSRKRQDAKQAKQQQYNLSNLQLPEPDQEYAKVVKILGDCRFRVCLPNQKEYLGILCRRMFRRVWIQVDNVVLVSLREFQQDKVDIIHRYSDQDVRMLVKHKHIPLHFVHGEESVKEEEQNSIGTLQEMKLFSQNHGQSSSESSLLSQENVVLDVDRI